MPLPQNKIKLLIMINNSNVGNSIIIRREYSSMLYLLQYTKNETSDRNQIGSFHQIETIYQ